MGPLNVVLYSLLVLQYVYGFFCKPQLKTKKHINPNILYLLSDLELLQDLSHGSVSKGKVHKMASQQARLLSHALSCKSKLNTHSRFRRDLLLSKGKFVWTSAPGIKTLLTTT